MARRSDHSRKELYELAINAARRIVETDGFRALTARNVADAIGYSPGTLYNLFANLDDLMIHLNGRTLGDLHDQLSAVFVEGHPDRDIHRLLACYLEFLYAHPGLWQMLFEYSLPDGRERPDWYARKIESVMGIVENALAPLFNGKDDAEAGNAARVLWAGLHGITSLASAGKMQVVTPQSVTEMTKILVTNFVAGIRVGGAAGNPE